MTPAAGSIVINGVAFSSPRPAYAIRIVPSIGCPFSGFFHSPRIVTPLGILRFPLMTYFPAGTNSIPPLTFDGPTLVRLLRPFWKLSVSSVIPSPLAPKSVTEYPATKASFVG